MVHDSVNSSIVDEKKERNAREPRIYSGALAIALHRVNVLVPQIKKQQQVQNTCALTAALPGLRVKSSSVHLGQI